VIKRLFLSALSGFLAGTASAVFLLLLDIATRTRDDLPTIIWALPIAGFVIGWLFHNYGGEVGRGTNLILDEIHDPKKIIPLRMAPFILIGTILTHLFGGSAGREGTAVQMGASLSDQISNFFGIPPEERRALLVAGAGAGFGAAIGAPLAGVIFGMELISIRKFKPIVWMGCLVASFVAYYTAIFLGAKHSVFPSFEIPSMTFNIIFYVAIAGIIFGLTAKFFMRITHFVEAVSTRFISFPPLRPFVVGGIIVILFYLEGSYHYVGLGIPIIQDALEFPASFKDSIYKAGFTALTVGSGFKGGEFIPLVFIGTTLGSALSVFIPVSFQLLGGLGFAAVFAGAAKTPIACSLMAMEIFGYEILPYALIACFMSNYVSGKATVYKS